jgi:hypothetical protein
VLWYGIISGTERTHSTPYQRLTPSHTHTEQHRLTHADSSLYTVPNRAVREGSQRLTPIGWGVCIDTGYQGL